MITQLQRLIKTSVLSLMEKRKLHNLHASLNPFLLQRQVSKKMGAFVAQADPLPRFLAKDPRCPLIFGYLIYEATRSRRGSGCGFQYLFSHRSKECSSFAEGFLELRRRGGRKNNDSALWF